MKTTFKLLLLLVTISIFNACCPLFYPYGEGRGYHGYNNRYYHHENHYYGHDRGYYGNDDHRDRDDDRN